MTISVNRKHVVVVEDGSGDVDKDAVGGRRNGSVGSIIDPDSAADCGQ
jgi:hypothetical protein